MRQQTLVKRVRVVMMSFEIGNRPTPYSCDIQDYSALLTAPF